MGNVNKIIERVNSQREPEYKRGEIYYIERGGYVVGSEQAAGRPAIIVSNNLANKHSDNVTVVYLTTQPKTELPTHVFINSAQKVSIALCECIVSVSKERIGSYYGKATPEEMEQISAALCVALELTAERATVPQKDVLRQQAEENTNDAEKRLKEAESGYKTAVEALEQARKEAAFYKMMYEDVLEKTRRLAVGGGITYAGQQ